MFSWVTALIAFLRLLNSITNVIQERDMLKAGEAEALAAVLRSQADGILAAKAAREEARSRSAAVPPGSSLPDDGFRRD